MRSAAQLGHEFALGALVMSKRQFDRVFIEIGNVCNLACHFCPKVLRPNKFMTLAEFAKVVREVKPYAKDVTLHVMGEPLLHPLFSEIVGVLEENALPLFLITNGILIDKHNDTLLSSSVVKQINFSVHSFFANFPDGNLSDYLQKISEFSRKFINNNPRAFVNFRLWNLPDVKVKMDNTNLRIYRELASIFANPNLPAEVDVRQQKSYRLERHIKLHFDSQFEWPSLNSDSSKLDGVCFGLRKQLAILSDGTVVPCCLDKEAAIALGSLFDKSLSEILEGERAQRFVQGFAKNRAIEPLCQRCQYKNRVSEKKDLHD